MAKYYSGIGKSLVCFVLLFIAISFSSRANVNRSCEYDEVVVDPATAIAVAQVALQVWQSLGPQDQSIGQILTMLQIIDSKIDVLNSKMDIIIDELSNLDEKTYLFFKKSEGEVLFQNMITFDRALFLELKDILQGRKRNSLNLMDYRIVYEKSKDGWSAYIPDLPGCTSAGADREEIEKNILEAIKLHLEVIADSQTGCGHP